MYQARTVQSRIKALQFCRAFWMPPIITQGLARENHLVAPQVAHLVCQAPICKNMYMNSFSSTFFQSWPKNCCRINFKFAVCNISEKSCSREILTNVPSAVQHEYVGAYYTQLLTLLTTSCFRSTMYLLIILGWRNLLTAGYVSLLKFWTS